MSIYIIRCNCLFHIVMSLIDDMPVDDGSVEIILVLDEIVEFHFCHIVPLTDVVKDIFQVNGLYLLGAIIIGDMKFHGLCGGMDDVDDVDGTGGGG